MLRRVTDHLLRGAAAAVDRAATLAVEAGATRRRTRVAISHETRARFLERVAAEYPEQPSLDFFGPAPILSPSLRRVRGERGLGVFDAAWPSEYTPFSGTIRERYTASAQNQLALARLFLREAPRPVVVIVHGYMSGHLPLEERLWPIEQLDRLGFDVALFVLPFHGLRGRSASSIPEFPGNDPRMTNEGFRQAVTDLRGLIGWLRQRGHPRVGLFGMSLGGYTAALTATVEPGLDFLVPIVPLACLADFAREQGSLSDLPQEAATEHALLERAYRVTSPLSLLPRIAPERVLVVGARSDRVTPVGHARKLSTHFRSPILAWPGGHLLQFGRREAFERIFALIVRER
ncbi:MAG TPA: alpha/beta hydrolase [Polyangiaceae bacterium]